MEGQNTYSLSNKQEHLWTDEILIETDGFMHMYGCPAREKGLRGYGPAWVSNGSMSPIFYDNFEVTVMRGKTHQTQWVLDDVRSPYSHASRAGGYAALAGVINHYGSACAYAPAIAYGLRINSIDGHPEDYTSAGLSAGFNMYTSKELQTGEFDPSASTDLEMYDFIRACPLSAVLMRPLRLVHARFYDPQLGRWFAPDPAEQFSNPYLAMGRTKREESLRWSDLASGQPVGEGVMYVDPDGRFAIEAVTIATVIIKATSTAAVIAKTAAAVTAAASAAYMASQMVPMISKTLMPPDGYIQDGNYRYRINDDGAAQGLDYIYEGNVHADGTYTRTGRFFTEPMGQPTIMKPVDGSMTHAFNYVEYRHLATKIPSISAGPLGSSAVAPGLQGGVAALGPMPAVGAGFCPLGLLGAGAGGWAAAGAYSYFNPRTQNWWSTSQQRYYNGNSFTGNQYTNNGMRGARGISNAFTGVGYGLGAYNAHNFNALHSSGQITDFQMLLEQGSNTYSTLGGIYGAAWEIG